MPNTITPADARMIDRLLNEVFDGGVDRTSSVMSAQRRLLLDAVEGGEADESRLREMLAAHAGLARTLLNDNYPRTKGAPQRSRAERAADNDMNGVRRRARETKDQNDLL